MNSKLRHLVLVGALFAIGLGTALLGTGKEADAAGPDLFLGKKTSATTVYFVNDWFCPVCIRTEPVIEKIYPTIAGSARIGFVDFPIHGETTNFTPYNTYFLTHEKGKYIAIRKALSALARKTKKPSHGEVKAAVAPLGVKLPQLKTSDTLFGLQANLMIYRGYDVTMTPTAVVTNSRTKKTRLLAGKNRISELSIKTAIAQVENR